eukprot:gene9462-10449_t
MSRKIADGIQDLTIDMDLCRGQGYDGAGNMAGKCSGAPALIMQMRLMFIVGLMSHVLDLRVASAGSIQVIVCLIIVSRCLEITLKEQLQTPSIDVVAANEKITLLYASLQRLRMEKSIFHCRWYGEAEKLASSINIEPGKLRTAQKQLNRANTPAESISEYYERVLTLPFIDHLTSEMQNRFSERNRAIPGKSCVATRMETKI